MLNWLSWATDLLAGTARRLLFFNRYYQNQPPEVFYKKGTLKIFSKFTGKHLCQRRFFNKLQAEVCNFIEKKTPAQVLSCEFWYKFLRTPLLQNASRRLLLCETTTYKFWSRKSQWKQLHTQRIFRSSRLEVFCKKKLLLKVLQNSPATLLKKKL